MKTIILSVILLTCIGGFAAFFAYSVRDLRRNWPLITKAWKQMEAFERGFMPMGLTLFVLFPALQDHPAADWYFARVVMEVLPALAGGLFVAGVIAFSRQVHELRGAP